MREKLAELGDDDQEIDWSDGQHFPWWLWLANTGDLAYIFCNDGISHVRLRVSNGFKCVVVDSVRRTYYISMRGSDRNMIVRDVPRLYRG